MIVIFVQRRYERFTTKLSDVRHTRFNSFGDIASEIRWNYRMHNIKQFMSSFIHK
jgi:hypothetical protein